MKRISKVLPYLLIVLDIFALLVLQNMADCAGINTPECTESPSLLIIGSAVVATGFYFYKRHKAKQPFLPSFFSLKYDTPIQVDAVPQTITPPINRLFFGCMAFMMMSSYFVTVYHYANGSNTPPYAHWSLYALPLVIGLTLITLKDEIKVRLHPFWTPFGLLYLAAAWAIVLFVDLPQGTISGYSLFDSIGEGFWFATGFGLLLAFIGLKPLYKRVFYFIPLAFFGVLFGAIEFINQVESIVQQKPVEWDAFLDLTWLAGGYFVAYLLIVRLIKNRPPLMIMAKAMGLIIVLIVINMSVSRNIVSKAFPQKSWQHHWFRGYLPVYNLQCNGAECNNEIYREPYGFCVDGNGISRGSPAPFYDIAQARTTKKCRYELNTDIQSMKVICSHPITGINADSADLPVVDCGNTEFEGIYSESGINRLRQKTLYYEE